MDGDSSCLRGSSDDVTGGGEMTALNTIENRGGHLGGVRGYWRRGDAPKPICKSRIQSSIFLKFGIGEIKSNPFSCTLHCAPF